MPSISDEDAFWYGGDAKQSPVNYGGAPFGQPSRAANPQNLPNASTKPGQSKLPNQVLKRAAQNQDQMEEDMGFYGVSVKTNNKATFQQKPNKK